MGAIVQRIVLCYTLIMERPSLYLETTIISYLGGRISRDVVVLAHQELTLQWWHQQRGNFDMYTSEIVFNEAQHGDKEAAGKRVALLAGIPVLAYTPDVERLARRYYEELSFPEKALADSFHLAFAIHYSLDYLLTWNCRHLANEILQRRLVKLNESLQLATPLIVTPEELIALSEEEP
ncbi:MAG: type II toxin-antitoxin system VapC family toxin [Candidatus Eremiobacteraeota bacterium]|nr:type II toxin-antitoxin system VapC family toxin [Candidatus Eremiobacteraeota bacterium]